MGKIRSEGGSEESRTGQESTARKEGNRKGRCVTEGNRQTDRQGPGLQKTCQSSKVAVPPSGEGPAGRWPQHLQIHPLYPEFPCRLPGYPGTELPGRGWLVPAARGARLAPAKGESHEKANGSPHSLRSRFLMLPSRSSQSLDSLAAPCTQQPWG